MNSLTELSIKNTALSFNKEEPGHLITKTSLTLHTLQSKKLLMGIATARGSIGLWSFATAVRKIWGASAHDDPYADWWLLKIYDALKQAEHFLKQQQLTLKEQLKTFSKLQLEKGQSVKPVVIPLHFTLPYGYLAANNIGSFDTWARQLFAAKTIGMVASKIFYQNIHQGMREVLRSFNKAYQWKDLGAFDLKRRHNPINSIS